MQSPEVTHLTEKSELESLARALRALPQVEPEASSWERIAPLLPGACGAGRPRRTDLREVLNAIRYLVRTGCGWRMPPKDFPPWQTVYWWFRRLIRLTLFATIHELAVMLDRQRAGRTEARPAGV